MGSGYHALIFQENPTLKQTKKSRLFNDQTEWKLKDTIFLKITEKWGIPDIDLFASRLNFFKLKNVVPGNQIH